MIYSRILDSSQLNILENIEIIPQSYLAGGTALALQLGHRTSLDLDFYTQKHFNPETILKDLENEFKKIKLRSIAKDTLLVNINEVEVSLFYYPYSLIESPVPFRNVKLASVKDIAAMKLVAISARGKRRDFVDVYYLLKNFSLKQIIDFTLTKYPSFQPMVILKGLIYFEDAEKDDLERGIRILDKSFSWKNAKEYIFNEVKKYQLSVLKG